MSNNDTLLKDSTYLRYVPALYQKPEDGRAAFISRYLKIFEKILSGIDDDVTLSAKEEPGGIAETLDTIHDFFHPSTTRPEFLDWIASWMGLVLKEGWSEEKKREIIARIIPIYRMRGTKKGLEEFIKIYAGTGVEVREDSGSFAVGESRVGVDTIIGEGIVPYFFRVNVNLTARLPRERKRRMKSIKAVIDMEKPVHASYILRVTIPTLRLGYRDGSTVGENTLIGGTKVEIDE